MEHTLLEETAAALPALVKELMHESFLTTEAEHQKAANVIKELTSGVPPPEPACEVDDGNAVASAGLPRVNVIALPEPESPYMMNPHEAPNYAIRAFVPLWKQLKVTRTALTSVINGLRVMITKWNNEKKDLVETHVALNQGKMHVPWGKPMKMLHAGLALALQSGMECWITEIKTPWYRYFADFDFVQPEKLVQRQIEALVFVVQRAVRRFFPNKSADDPLFYAIVCSTGYKPVFKDKMAERAYHTGMAAAAVLNKEDSHLMSANDRATFLRHVDAMPKPVAWKTGVHMLWVSLYVNNNMALIMRETVIFELAKTFGVRVEPMNDWTDVVDVTVYKGSGLRMVGNRKSDPCPQCKGAHRVNKPAECVHCVDSDKHECSIHLHWTPLKKKDAEAGYGIVCPTCDGNGRVDTGRPYMPMLVVDSQGYRRRQLEEVYCRDFVRLINDTSIRWRGVPWAASTKAERDRAACAAAQHENDKAREKALTALDKTNEDVYLYEQPHGQGWQTYEGMPKPVTVKAITGPDGLEHYVEEEADLSKAVSHRKKRGAAGDAAAPNPLEANKEPKGMTVELSRADPLNALFEDFIHVHAGSMYRDLRVTQVATNKDRTCYFVNVQGLNCHYCNNVGRDHGSNRIYFMFSNDGMVQRCHKRGPQTKEMKYGPCAMYRSAPVNLGQEIKVRLFPKVASKTEDTGTVGIISNMQSNTILDDEDALMSGDVTYDPMRDPKALSLLQIGDQLCKSLYNMSWSKTLEGCQGRHYVRVDPVDVSFCRRADMLAKAAASRGLPSFIEVDFSGLGQRAAAVLQTHGFFAKPAELATPPKSTHAPLLAQAANHGQGMLSNLEDALDGGYEEEHKDTGKEKGKDKEKNPALPSIQRTHAVLMRQFAYVIDAAVSLPAATVTECLTLGGCSQLVEAFKVQRESKPAAYETGPARIARVAAKAARARSESKGQDLATWITAMEEARTLAEKEELNAAYTHWQVYFAEHPSATPEDAAAYVRSRSKVLYTSLASIKRRREAAATNSANERPSKRAAALPRAGTGSVGPRFKSLREVEDS